MTTRNLILTTVALAALAMTAPEASAQPPVCPPFCSVKAQPQAKPAEQKPRTAGQKASKKVKKQSIGA
jgi:hypothetical protein